MAAGLLALPTSPLWERGPNLRCRHCGHENTGGRFCGECGEPLPPRRARKEVTVLVADVSGFTALSERLDPEDVRGLLDLAFDVILEAVHGHHGRINQFLGDGVMAMFEGAGVVAGDEHRRRALRAALAIQRGLAPIREEIQYRHGIDFLVRIGVHTGPIVVGAIGEGLRNDYTAAGETTRIAIGLANLAEPGHIAISDRLERSAEGLVMLADLGETALADQARPIRALAVRGELCEWIGDLRRPVPVVARASRRA